MPAAEKDLLKLMTTDPVYIDLPEDVRDSRIQERTAAGSIYEDILQICDGRHILDSSAAVRTGWMRSAPVCLARNRGGDDVCQAPSGHVFDDCIAQIRKKECSNSRRRDPRTPFHGG